MTRPHVAAEHLARGTEAPSASAVYAGWVRHRRFAPREHAFDYQIAMLYIDLAELDSLFDKRWLWSLERGNVATFRRSDYMAPHDVPLDEAVRRRVEQQIGRRPEGPIRLLTHLRYFGHVFNPVTFYYCFAADGHTLDVIAAEITNTPWKERHVYALPVESAERHGHAMSWAFRKGFHVSPFMPMDRDYDWRFTVPEKDLRVHMNVLTHGERDFDATLVLERQPLDAESLRRVLWRYPAMTLKVVAAIHWEALKLWLKRTPVHDHPSRKPPPDTRGH